VEDFAMSTETQLTQSTGNGGGVATEQRRANGSEAVLRPPVDIYETGQGITLRADMPGVAKDRLNVRVEGNNLLVEGSIGVAPQDQMTALYADVRSTVYRRRFALSNELEADHIDAHLKDGVLTVHIPKRAELRARRIEIKS
jgi:HSP20 family protein